MDTTELIAPTEPQDTRRDLLEEQFDEVAAESRPEPAQARPPRVRAENGTFAATPKAVDADEAVEEPVEEPVWKRAPASWKKDHHEVWQAADPRMQ